MIHLLVFALLAAVAYAVYKHVGKAKIEADVKAAVAKAESIVSPTAASVIASIKADFEKYL